ncbi:MAG: serine hydrolase [Propionicimonas sp.]|uniref:serine hydrolase n=1 Tax=Propionicimonas sp. TaxID=1955623 RepID=UPI003D0C68ED
MSADLTTEVLNAWDAALAGVDAEASLLLRNGAGVVAQRRPDAPHYAASTVKLAVLCALLSRGVDEGSTLRVHDTFESAAGGSFTLRQSDDQDDATWARLGSEVAVGELAERMITVSSNIAMDLLVERIGLAAVRDFLDRVGLGRAILLRRLIGDASAEAARTTNTVTAAGLAALMAGLADASVLPRPQADHALAILGRQQHRGMIPAGLPESTASASKGGWVPGVNHDVAFVRPDAAPPYVLAVCTTHHLDHEQGQALVARLSRTTWEHWMTWHA